jgi:outer membrane protein assembly factor BamB
VYRQKKYSCTLAVLLAFALLATVSVTVVRANDWPKAGYDTINTGCSPEEISGFNPWEKTLSTQEGVCDVLSIADGVIYVGSDKWLYALNASSGAQIWKFSAHPELGSTFIGPAVVKSGIVYANNWEYLYAINATTGEQLWVYTTSTCNYTPNVANGIVYFGSLDNSTYALNATTGQKIWQFTAGFFVWDVCPAVANGLVYVGSTDHNVYALDAFTGAKVWQYTTPNIVLRVAPAVANGMVYLGGGDMNFYALDASTGRLIWSYFTGGQPHSSVVVDGIVCFGSGLGVYALNATTGALIWNYPTIRGIHTSPAYVDGAVYFGDLSCNVFALDIKTGEKLWGITLADFPSSPAIAGHSVFVDVQDGTIHAYRTVYAITVKSDNEAGFTSQRRFVNYSCSVNVSFTPKSGYKITNVYINGQEMGPITSYNFVGVQAPSNVTIMTQSLFSNTPSPTAVQTPISTTVLNPKPTSTIIPSTEPTSLPETTTQTPNTTPSTGQNPDLLLEFIAIVAVSVGLLGSFLIHSKKRKT